MSTNAPQRTQDTTPPKEHSTSKDVSASRDQAAEREQNVSKEMAGGKKQTTAMGRDREPSAGREANMEREQGSKEQNAAREIKNDIANSAQSMRELVKELAKVTTKGGEEILRMQSEACAESIAESMDGLTPTAGSKGPISMLWDFPHQYQTQSERMVKSMLNYLSVMARIQQQQLELLGPTLHRNIENTSHTIAQLNGVLASRRGPSSVLNFMDRRGTGEWSTGQQQSRGRDRSQQEREREREGSQAYAESETSEQGYAEQGYGGGQRAGRQGMTAE